MRNLYVFIVLLLAASCKNYHNEMIEWSDSIPIGTNVIEVKKNQSHYIKIDWDHPETSENASRYAVTELKGDRDILPMAYYLVFVADRYQGRLAKK